MRAIIREQFAIEQIFFQKDAFVNVHNLSRNKILRPLVVYAANNDKVGQTHHLFFIIDWLTGQS